jgi:hypothetical protein
MVFVKVSLHFGCTSLPINFGYYSHGYVANVLNNYAYLVCLLDFWCLLVGYSCHRKPINAQCKLNGILGEPLI